MSGKIRHLSILRNSSPMYDTYMASRGDHLSSLDARRMKPNATPPSTPAIVAKVNAFLRSHPGHFIFSLLPFPHTTQHSIAIINSARNGQVFEQPTGVVRRAGRQAINRRLLWKWEECGSYALFFHAGLKRREGRWEMTANIGPWVLVSTRWRSRSVSRNETTWEDGVVNNGVEVNHETLSGNTMAMYTRRRHGQQTVAFINNTASNISTIFSHCKKNMNKKYISVHAGGNNSSQHQSSCKD